MESKIWFESLYFLLYTHSKLSEFGFQGQAQVKSAFFDSDDSAVTSRPTTKSSTPKPMDRVTPFAPFLRRPRSILREHRTFEDEAFCCARALVEVLVMYSKDALRCLSNGRDC